MTSIPNDFNQPAEGGGYFEAKNAVGHLVLITKVHDIYHNPTNVFGGKPMPRDEAKVDLVDLDALGQEHRERVIVTHPGLVNRLTAGATNILGRIGQVPTTKGNPAFVLEGHQPADITRAQQWVAGYQAGQFRSPDPAPSQDPWGASSAPQGNPAASLPTAGVPQPQAAPQQSQNPPAAAALAAMPPEQLAALMAQLGATQIPQGQPAQDPPF